MASTASPVHVTARIRGETGTTLLVGADCDGVVIQGTVILGRAGREDFARAYAEAERLAEEWAAQYGGGHG